jgi:uncharacterized protein (DUF305 family)
MVTMPESASLSNLHGTASPATRIVGMVVAARGVRVCVPRSTKGIGVTTRSKLTIGVATLAALATLTACSASSSDQANTSPSTATPSAPATAAHNNADVMFAQHMNPHHEQAIEMSDIILAKQGIDPRVMELAGQIKAAQAPEIEQMQNWLAQWGEPTMSTMPSDSMMPGMPSHSVMPGMDGMAGMMSDQDMTMLQNAKGVDASKLFLQQMIAHHQGAITMAQQEISSGQYPDAVALARSIETSQQQEINTMQGILGTL